MHPIEHMYYFSCAFIPSLYFAQLSPLVFLWNFVHLSISPGAGHSGWEDHFQADQYHFIHHAKFECNYGSPSSGCVDQYMGTFREVLGKSKVYTGEWSETNDDNAEAIAKLKQDKAATKAATATATTGGAAVWSVNGYLGLPASWDHAVYIAYWAALFPLTWCALTGNLALLRLSDVQSPIEGVSVAKLALGFVAWSPPLVAIALSKLAGDKMNPRWPFQKERIFGSFGVFVLLGVAVCIVPIYHSLVWLL